jgi:hypothetical protein
MFPRVNIQKKYFPMICGLCEREVSRIHNHHLVPKKMMKKKSVKRKMQQGIYMIDTITEQPKFFALCVDCTKMVHALFSLKELANEYNTPEKLRKHPKIIEYVMWVRNKNEGVVKHPKRAWLGGGKYE